jgi:hypothetical protein
MGRNNNDFYGGSNSARWGDGAASQDDSHGALEATVKEDGPAALSTTSSQNRFTGHTAGAVAYNGTS